MAVFLKYGTPNIYILMDTIPHNGVYKNNNEMASQAGYWNVLLLSEIPLCKQVKCPLIPGGLLIQDVMLNTKAHLQNEL